jgi:hypothetical protein
MEGTTKPRIDRDLGRAEVKAALARVRQWLNEGGLLLCHDARHPSAPSIIVGKPVSGSWWGHPKNKLIYDTLLQLASDVLWVKLVCKKETLVQRRLWPALLRVATSGDDWQTGTLSTEAKSLLERVRTPVSVEELSVADRSTNTRKLAAELEQRLLVHVYERHTEAGRHTRVLEPWATWQRQVGLSDEELPTLAAAYAALNQAVEGWLGAWLPWTSSAPKRARASERG